MDTKIDLSYKNLTHINETFKYINNKENITYINLSDNEIKHINDNVFLEFINLKELDLSRNNLTNINNIKFPDSLEILYLTWNDLTNIDNVIFPNSLQKINLSGNKLTNIDNIKFPSSLEILNLRNNKLTNINKNIYFNLINLDRLFLDDNNLLKFNFSSKSKYLDKYRIITKNILFIKELNKCAVCFEVTEILKLDCHHLICNVCYDILINKYKCPVCKK